MNNAD